MKRRIVVCLLALVMLANVALCARAVSPRIITIAPGIEFNGETATCTVNVCANYTTDSIFAIVKLFDENNTCVKTWVQSGSGFLNFSRTIEVTSGVEYTLRAYVTINDESNPAVSVTGTCP